MLGFDQMLCQGNRSRPQHCPVGQAFVTAKVLLGGIAQLGRFIDNVRLCIAGTIQDCNSITVGLNKY